MIKNYERETKNILQIPNEKCEESVDNETKDYKKREKRKKVCVCEIRRERDRGGGKKKLSKKSKRKSV